MQDWKGAGVVDRGGLENRCTLCVPWVRIPPFPQNEEEVPCGLLSSFYVTGAADSNTQGSPSTFRSLSKRSGERIPPFPHKLNERLRDVS